MKLIKKIVDKIKEAVLFVYVWWILNGLDIDEYINKTLKRLGFEIESK